MTLVRLLGALCFIMVLLTAIMALGAKLGDRFGLEQQYTSLEVATAYLGGALTVMIYHYRLEAIEAVRRKERK